PPGDFVMGDAAIPQAPVHRVHLADAYFLADCEATVRQFLSYVEDLNQRGESPNWGGWAQNVSPTLDCPVQKVSWFDAIQFCNWLSVAEGRQQCYRRVGETWTCDFSANGYRLPTEAEWEYACRAGSSTKFAFGDAAFLIQGFGIYRGNSESQ